MNLRKTLFAIALLLSPAVAFAHAGHDQRARALGMAKAEMQAGEAAHGQADDMSLVDLQMIHHRQDVVGGALLAVALGFFGDGAVIWFTDSGVDNRGVLYWRKNHAAGL